ncbi:MAG: uroporphyrinogen decarboxylase family protein [Thermodesulfobacteriota bacterium]
MSSMSHRERVLTTLNLQEPDRVPLDFGSSIATTIIMPAYESLKKYLGLEHETQIMMSRSRTVIPDKTILERFDIDTYPLVLGEYRGGAAKEIDHDILVDFWGTTWKRTPDGHFINVKGPFQNRQPRIELLETYEWPDPGNPGLFEGLKQKAEALYKNTDYAIVLNLPVGIVHLCQYMRGFAEWLMDLQTNTEFACRLLDLITDIWIKIAENALDEVGDNIDVIMWGDDLAMQQGPFMSPQMYRDLIKPSHKRMNAALKARSNAKIHYHSCGSVYLLVEDLIDTGIDALNPIQVNARNMDPARLKEEFGDRLAFWGGIDTQKVLPFGKPEEVRQEVRRIIDCMGKGGGYILASVHNIQAEVPPENIVAMFEEGKSYGKY